MAGFSPCHSQDSAGLSVSTASGANLVLDGSLNDFDYHAGFYWKGSLDLLGQMNPDYRELPVTAFYLDSPFVLAGSSGGASALFLYKPIQAGEILRTQRPFSPSASREPGMDVIQLGRDLGLVYALDRKAGKPLDAGRGLWGLWASAGSWLPGFLCLSGEPKDGEKGIWGLLNWEGGAGPLKIKLAFGSQFSDFAKPDIAARAELRLRLQPFRLDAQAAWADQDWYGPGGNSQSGYLLAARLAMAGKRISFSAAGRAKALWNGKSPQVYAQARTEWKYPFVNGYLALSLDGSQDDPLRKRSISWSLGTPFARSLKLGGSQAWLYEETEKTVFSLDYNRAVKKNIQINSSAIFEARKTGRLLKAKCGIKAGMEEMEIGADAALGFDLVSSEITSLSIGFNINLPL